MLANHFLLAGNKQKGLTYALAAQKQLERQNLSIEAADLGDKIWDLVKHGTDREIKSSVLEHLGDLRFVSAEYGKALQAYHKLGRIHSRKQGYSAELCEKIGKCLYTQADYVKAFQWFKKAEQKTRHRKKDETLLTTRIYPKPNSPLSVSFFTQEMSIIVKNMRLYSLKSVWD